MGFIFACVLLFFPNLKIFVLLKENFEGNEVDRPG